MKSLKNWDNKTWLSSQKYIQTFNKFLLNQVKLDKNSRILDVGCGRGRILANLSNKLKLLDKPYVKAFGSYDIEQEFVEDMIIDEITKIIKNFSRSNGNSKFNFIKKIGSSQYNKISNQIEKAILVAINKIFKDIMGKKPFCDIKIWIS